MKRILILFVLIFITLNIQILSQEVSEIKQNTEGETPEMITTIPSKISYQGVLTDNNGIALTGQYNMQFRLYTTSSGGTAIWTETQNSVDVNNGIFNVYLGSITSLNNLAFDVPYWLGITIGSTTFTDRIELSASAYSMRTKSVEDGSITGSSIASGQVVKGLNNLKDNVNIVGGSNINVNTSGSTITISASNGGGGTVTEINTGSGLTGGPINTIGTISIQNDGVTSSHLASNSVTESKIQNNAVTNSKLGINSVTDSKVSFPFSKTISTGGIAFSVINNSSGVGISGLGSSRGVWGETSSSTGRGVYGLATSTSGSNYGVYGMSSSSTGNGVYGTGFLGVFGHSSNGTAVYGQKSGGGNYAGYFEGNTHIVGTLSATNKTFVIDHPLEPENKILRHSCIESPEMINIYNGNITTDASGFVIIQLPEYFESLNKDFKYQLTVVGQFAQAIVSREIQNNSFTIQTDKPNVKVSWQVTGIRKDPWAEKNPIIVEEQKSSETRGYYLNPDAYNQPKTRSVEWVLHPELMKQIEEKSGEE